MALRRHLSTMVGFGLVVYAAARMAWADGRRLHLLLFSATEKAWGLLNRIAAARK